RRRTAAEPFGRHQPFRMIGQSQTGRKTAATTPARRQEAGLPGAPHGAERAGAPARSTCRHPPGGGTKPAPPQEAGPHRSQTPSASQTRCPVDKAVSSSAERRLVLLGATGSIGTNALDVVEALPGRFEVVGLSAHSGWEKLFEQARRHRPRCVALTDP